MAGSGSGYIPAVAGDSRVFVIEGRARPDHRPVYKWHLKGTGISKSFGTPTLVQVNDYHRYNAWVTVRKMKGAVGTVETTLVGKFPRNLKTNLLKMAQNGCPFDIQFHFGECSEPSDENAYSKILILENVDASQWSTNDVGAIDSAGQADVMETLTISASVVYESMQGPYSEKGKTLITTEILDLVLCDAVSCGDCADESSGYEKIYGISTAAGGSPTTPPDLIFSQDEGQNWKAHDIDAFTTAQAPTAIACVGPYLVITGGALNKAGVGLKSEVLAGIDPAFSTVVAGLIAGAGINDIWSVGNIAFCAADFGYIYSIGNEALNGFTVLDSGQVTTAKLNAVHALDENFAILVGNSGTIVFSNNASGSNVFNFTLSPSSPVGVGVNMLAVWAKSLKEWWVVTSAPSIWRTLDSGVSWTLCTMPGLTPTALYEIQFPTDSVGYVSGTVTINGVVTGRIWKSTNGGYSWVIQPAVSGKMPYGLKFKPIATSEVNADFIVIGGLAVGTDGIVVVGEDSEAL